uniref:Uncharacterized protein n=1 Tax=Romanomermis culicivorax TaxID=13658 RepID=A0A915HIH7_ROMCU
MKNCLSHVSRFPTVMTSLESLNSLLCRFSCEKVTTTITTLQKCFKHLSVCLRDFECIERG